MTCSYVLRKKEQGSQNIGPILYVGTISIRIISYSSVMLMGTKVGLVKIYGC